MQIEKSGLTHFFNQGKTDSRQPASYLLVKYKKKSYCSINDPWGEKTHTCETCNIVTTGTLVPHFV